MATSGSEAIHSVPCHSKINLFKLPNKRLNDCSRGSGVQCPKDRSLLELCAHCSGLGWDSFRDRGKLSDKQRREIENLANHSSEGVKDSMAGPLIGRTRFHPNIYADKSSGYTIFDLVVMSSETTCALYILVNDRIALWCFCKYLYMKWYNSTFVKCVGWQHVPQETESRLRQPNEFRFFLELFYASLFFCYRGETFIQSYVMFFIDEQDNKKSYPAVHGLDD